MVTNKDKKGLTEGKPRVEDSVANAPQTRSLRASEAQNAGRYELLTGITPYEESANAARTNGAADAAGQGYPNPAGITQSFYQNPTNAGNYESGKPVYRQSQAVTDAAGALVNHRQNKPGEYQSQYSEQIQQMIDKALNRQKFNYDFSADPLYQQYADQYQRRGQMAMQDAMAQSAALTGGYGNSYAQQAGQQTYQQYLEQLNNVIPELRNQSYQAYRDEGDRMLQNLSMLQGQDDREYGKHRDDVGDWQNELNYLYSMYSDMSRQEYQRYMNDADAWSADRDYWYKKAYDAQQQANWQAEYNARYGGGSGGRGRSGGGSGSLTSTTREGAAKELSNLVKQGVVKAGSALYDQLVTQVSQKPKTQAQQQEANRKMSGYTK